MKWRLYIPLILVLGLTFCTNEPTDPVELYGEDALVVSGDSTLYLCRHEWGGIVLMDGDPNGLVAALPWRVPTKEEAVVLHKYLVDSQYGQRYLAQDCDGVWWTFLFGSGNVTKAGSKTKYALRPVRWQVAQSDTIIKL